MKNPKDRTVTITRKFDANIESVWEAWTKPELIAMWWSPKGITTKIAEHQFKVGGKWKFIMSMPDGKEFVAKGIYKEIEEFQRIASVADFKPMTEGVEIQGLFKTDDDHTEFTFHIVHPSVEYRIQQESMGIEHGWNSVFDRLDELLISSMNK